MTTKWVVKTDNWYKVWKLVRNLKKRLGRSERMFQPGFVRFP